MPDSGEEKNGTSDDEPRTSEPSLADDPELIDEPEEDEAAEPDSTVWCSHCGSHYIRHSSRRTPGDVLLALLCFRTFRCHSCYRRFHQFVPPGTVIKSWTPEEARKDSRGQAR